MFIFAHGLDQSPASLGEALESGTLGMLVNVPRSFWGSLLKWDQIAIIDDLNHRQCPLPEQSEMMHAPISEPRVMPALATPQVVGVASTEPAWRAAVLDLLERSGLRTGSSGDPVNGPPTLAAEDDPGPMAGWSDWLMERPQSHLLLLVPLPAVAVARSLGEGAVPKTALGQWLESAGTVLDVVRGQRRRVSLVFAEQVLAVPQAFLEALSQRLQLQLRSSVLTDLPPPGLPDALLHMMAENAIRQSGEARNIASELEANALPLTVADVRSAPQIEQVFNEYRDRIDTAAHDAQKLREENALLLAQLQEAQSQARQAEERTAEVRKDDARLHDLEEENQLLLQQVHQVQEELEHLYLQSVQTNSDELLEMQRRLQAAEDTVQALYNSKSWKLTRPLRWTLDLLTGGPKAGQP